MESVQPDFIFHLAAQSLNGSCFWLRQNLARLQKQPDFSRIPTGISTSAPFLTMQVNVEGTLNVLEAVKGLSPAKRPRVFNAGSSTVYGKTANEWEGPIPEHAPLQPVTPCKLSNSMFSSNSSASTTCPRLTMLTPALADGVSKVTQEMLAQQYFFAHGIHVVTGRFFQVSSSVLCRLCRIGRPRQGLGAQHFACMRR